MTKSEAKHCKEAEEIKSWAETVKERKAAYELEIAKGNIDPGDGAMDTDWEEPQYPEDYLEGAQESEEAKPEENGEKSKEIEEEDLQSRRVQKARQMLKLMEEEPSLYSKKQIAEQKAMIEKLEVKEQKGVYEAYSNLQMSTRRSYLMMKTRYIDVDSLRAEIRCIDTII